MISAVITVTRDDEEIEVYISGQTEYEVSPNPFETGEHVVDWSVDEPRGFDLTKEESARALEALEMAI